MKKWFRTRRAFWLGHRRLLLAFAFLLLALIAAVRFFGATEIDVDTSSGRIRSRHWLGCIVVSSRTSDTKFSQFAATLGKTVEPEHWECDETHSYFEPVSPYYRYHGTADALAKFMWTCEVYRIRNDDMTQMARQILDLLAQDKPEDVRAMVWNIRVDTPGQQGPKIDEKKEVLDGSR
jgi:hypothetical protein